MNPGLLPPTLSSPSFPVALVVKSPPANSGDIRDVGSTPSWEDLLEEDTATHSSILAWRTKEWTQLTQLSTSTRLSSSYMLETGRPGTLGAEVRPGTRDLATYRSWEFLVFKKLCCSLFLYLLKLGMLLPTTGGSVTLKLYSLQDHAAKPSANRGSLPSGWPLGVTHQRFSPRRSAHCNCGISNSPSSPACPSLFGAIYLIATPHDGLFKGERGSYKPVKAIIWY